eukprot:scaffold17071_cov177-Skeletonema_menzelii.AAC.1
MDRGIKPEEREVIAHPLDGINPHGMFESLAKKENEKPQNTLIPSLPLTASTPIPEEDESAPKEGD